MLRLTINTHRDPVGAAASAATPAEPIADVELEPLDPGDAIARGWFWPYSEENGGPTAGTLWRRSARTRGEVFVEVHLTDPTAPDVRWYEPSKVRGGAIGFLEKEERSGRIPVRLVVVEPEVEG